VGDVSGLKEFRAGLVGISKAQVIDRVRMLGPRTGKGVSSGRAGIGRGAVLLKAELLTSVEVPRMRRAFADRHL
jgi:hypothetical protein